MKFSLEIGRANYLVQMLHLNEAIDQLSMVSNVHLCWHVLMMEDGHALRRELVLKVEAEGKSENDMEEAG